MYMDHLFKINRPVVVSVVIPAVAVKAKGPRCAWGASGLIRSVGDSTNCTRNISRRPKIPECVPRKFKLHSPGEPRIHFLARPFSPAAGSKRADTASTIARAAFGVRSVKCTS